jgi:exopolysaccharide biosynthesis polyprenyl glycosylphosphotransferase
LRRIVLTSRRIGGAVRRRLLLVGTQERVDAFLSAQPVDRSLAHVIGAALVRPLPPEAEGRGIDDDAAMAAHVARFLEPDDVVVLLGAADGGAARRCINAFISLPCTLHLALPHELDLLARSVPQLAGVPIVRVLPQPLSTGQLALKRAFDIVASGLAIVLLLPLLALVAAAIAVDSRGPVLFTQRRYGFNWQPFRIYKFRTMTVAEDGRVVRQAVADDPRVTRVGRLLRRTNLDELPQLLNVLAGSMSLVGPRPHAMVHDQTFMARIGSYSCRHNVKPGITGWAQVNGYRGEIASDEDLLRRLEYDLDYIRRWSIWFDLKIIILTALSPRAFRNAR